MNPQVPLAIIRGRGQILRVYSEHMPQPIPGNPVQLRVPDLKAEFADQSKPMVFKDSETTADYDNLSPQEYFSKHVAFENADDVIQIFRNDDSAFRIKYFRVFSQLPLNHNYLLKNETIQFMQECGNGKGAYLFEFLSEVRESILRGEFGEVNLLEKAGETLLPVRESLVANRGAFFTLGVALANLIHMTGYAIPGLSPIVPMSWFHLANKCAPVVTSFENYKNEVTDPVVLLACACLQDVIDSDTVLPAGDAIIVNCALQGDFVVIASKVNKFRAVYVKQQVLYHHYIGCRLSSLSFILEGLVAGGIMNYFQAIKGQVPKVFPQQKLIGANFLCDLVWSPTFCKWLTKLIRDYMNMIMTDQAALVKFWRMMTGEDFINSRTERVFVRPYVGAAVIFQICSREVFIPEYTVPDVFASVFATDFLFDL